MDPIVAIRSVLTGTYGELDCQTSADPQARPSTVQKCTAARQEALIRLALIAGLQHHVTLGLAPTEVMIAVTAGQGRLDYLRSSKCRRIQDFRKFCVKDFANFQLVLPITIKTAIKRSLSERVSNGTEYDIKTSAT